MRFFFTVYTLKNNFQNLNHEYIIVKLNWKIKIIFLSNITRAALYTLSKSLNSFTWHSRPLHLVSSLHFQAYLLLSHGPPPGRNLLSHKFTLYFVFSISHIHASFQLEVLCLPHQPRKIYSVLQHTAEVSPAPGSFL